MRVRPAGWSAAALVLAALLPLDSFAMNPPDADDRNPDSIPESLAPCPESPNCVSSRAERPWQRVEPFALARAPESSWDALKKVVSSMPRTKIVKERPGYLHVEFRSFVFRFVDDLELLDRGDGANVDVRSASRVGYSDLGVNRKRVERLRSALAEAGLLAGQTPR